MLPFVDAVHLAVGRRARRRWQAQRLLLGRRELRGRGQEQRDGEQSAGHSAPPSASRQAPSRLALILNRPTGPPASSPTITATIAAMNPPSDQPKMTTMLCSSSRRPAAPHQKRDHGDRAEAAENAGRRGEQAIDQALALGEGLGWRKPPHAAVLAGRKFPKFAVTPCGVTQPWAERRSLASAFADAVGEPAVEKRLIGRAALGEAQVALALQSFERAQQDGLAAGLSAHREEARRARRACPCRCGRRARGRHSRRRCG